MHAYFRRIAYLVVRDLAIGKGNMMAEQSGIDEWSV
jgi:hypothetical protein